MSYEITPLIIIDTKIEYKESSSDMTVTRTASMPGSPSLAQIQVRLQSGQEFFFIFDCYSYLLAFYERDYNLILREDQTCYKLKNYP